MKIAVIGAGWYGCHIANELTLDHYDVDLYESKSDIFQGASGFNQNRLHQGFHYPRSYVTREQSFSGFKQFIEKYGLLTSVIDDNIYAIAKNKSFIDFETYIQVMDASGVEYEICSSKKYDLKNISGAVKCNERLIRTDKARKYFRELLDEKLLLNTAITEIINKEDSVLVNNIHYDAVINCTWSTLLPFSKPKVYYEPFVTFLYKSDTFNSKAITIMDGPFFSIYPFSKNTFSLTHVDLNPIGKFATFKLAKEHIQKTNKSYFNAIRKKNEDAVMYILPTFNSIFTYENYFISYKTKLDDASDPRHCLISKKNRIIQVMSGKIDTIFTAYEEVIKWLKKY